MPSDTERLDYLQRMAQSNMYESVIVTSDYWLSESNVDRFAVLLHSDDRSDWHPDLRASIDKHIEEEGR